MRVSCQLVWQHRERASRAVGDRFHFTVYTASLVVTYFILGFWVCYIVFCLLRGLISCSRTLAKGGNPCDGCITFWRSMQRPTPVLPFTRLQEAELQVRLWSSLRISPCMFERPRPHYWFPHACSGFRRRGPSTQRGQAAVRGKGRRLPVAAYSR